MAARGLTSEAMQAAVDAVAVHGGLRPAATALGLPFSTLEKRLARARAAGIAAGANAVGDARRRALRGEVGGPPIPPGAVPPLGFIVDRNAGAYDADGRLLRQWVGTRRDAGEVFEVPAGHVVKGVSALTDAEGRTLVQWVKTREAEQAAGLADALAAHFAAYAGAAPLLPPPVEVEADLLTVYPLPDLHLGMYAWRPEAGDDYDLALAADLATDTVARLVAQARPSAHATILGLGDYFHANDHKGATPASGHRLDVDGRWDKVFEAGARVATAIVDQVAQRHETVEVVFLPGNHDPDASVCLRVALALFYQGNPRVRVHSAPGLAWYRRFGKVLLGATHGHTMKPDRMAMMLAADRARDWGETEFRHFFFGHVHHEAAREVGPVRVESFSTPAARDAYAAGAGFRSGRALSAITFDAAAGEVGRHRVNILPRPAA